ncbi:MAG: PIN domain-containing protein [Bryobacteraceae bacterium]|jgi:predicted nucleic acid-binding protein
MRVYFDTGVFIDFLSAHGNSILRTTDRRGRTPAELAANAERLFEKVGRAHTGATSCLTYYEVEEARYGQLKQSAKGTPRADTLLIPAARSITLQVQMMVDLFKISVLDLTAGTIRLQLQQIELQTRGIRAADALHAATAIAFEADLVVSTDDALLQLDGILTNLRGANILCRDTDSAFHLL